MIYIYISVILSTCLLLEQYTDPRQYLFHTPSIHGCQSFAKFAPRLKQKMVQGIRQQETGCME